MFIVTAYTSWGDFVRYLQSEYGDAPLNTGEENFSRFFQDLQNTVSFQQVIFPLYGKDENWRKIAQEVLRQVE